MIIQQQGIISHILDRMRLLIIAEFIIVRLWSFNHFPHHRHSFRENRYIVHTDIVKYKQRIWTTYKIITRFGNQFACSFGLLKNTAQKPLAYVSPRYPVAGRPISSAAGFQKINLPVNGVGLWFRSSHSVGKYFVAQNSGSKNENKIMT